MISIEEFAASYETTDSRGVVEWRQCRVVGVDMSESVPSFIVLTADDDGVLWPHEVQSVKPECVAVD